MTDLEARMGLFISQLVRIAGIVVALHEEFFGVGDRSSGFALAGLMMSGSLLTDAVIKRSQNNESNGGSGGA